MPIERSLIDGRVSAGRASGACSADELSLASIALEGGERQVELSVPDIHCGGCIARIEAALGQVRGVTRARVNLSTKRVSVRWRAAAPPPIIETLERLGFAAHIHGGFRDEHDPQRHELLRALAVAGFAAGNIMLLSIAVWSGADGMARDLFHWLSALIALPTLAYSGRVFFRSAWRGLRSGHVNMDAPISVGVLTAFGLSLYETIQHGAHAYFDASVSLLFFLLIGRTLDHFMREKARTAVNGLARLAARGAHVVETDGAERYLAVDDLRPGMILRIAPGERTPVNARIVSGQSDMDLSLISGESAPVVVRSGDSIWAGTLNLSGPLTARVTSEAKDSFLADMMRMMEEVEGERSVYRRVADRAARLYAPLVHLAALLTLAGWWMATGDAHRAITVAIAVLIITCPCALGLAVPMVHVVAARRMFEKGVMVKDGAALERLAEIDSVVFDKTGTLTLPEVKLARATADSETSIAIAAALARHSDHPYSRAIASANRNATADVSGIVEYPGAGIEALDGAGVVRLGRPAWATGDETHGSGVDDDAVVLAEGGRCRARFEFESVPRPDAHAAIRELKRLGLGVEMLSGDHDGPARSLAASLDIPYSARVVPGEKAAHVKAAAERGHKVLMVGDGLNDAPALMAAHVSMAPASAADVGRNAADFVFLRPSLGVVPETVFMARNAARIVRQNLALAALYNFIAVPIAVAGHVTPLIAAIAMSSSSLVVIANALRLSSGKSRRAAGETRPAPGLTPMAAG